MDTGQRCPAVPLPHYAVMRLGRYAQLQKIVFPEPYYLGELTEERGQGCVGLATWRTSARACATSSTRLLES
jgi:hypothetical protein